MTQQHFMVASFLLSALVLAPSHSIEARGSKISGPEMAQKQAQIQPLHHENLAPGVVEQMRSVHRLAGPLGAVALPSRFAGMQIKGQDNHAARGSYGPHYLSHDFEDGVHLDYYSDHTAEYCAVSAWESLPSGESVSLYASEWMGDSPSVALGYSENFEEDDAYKSMGRGLWDSTWMDGGQLKSESVVSEYESASGDTWWSYQGQDHHYKDWVNYHYSGGGHSAAEGNGSTYFGDSFIESAEEVDYGCYFFGESLYEYDDGYGSISDFHDECYQVGQPFHYYSMQSHSEYRWVASTGESIYEYAGYLTCSGEGGEGLAYVVYFNESDMSVKYEEMRSGEISDESGCAWMPIEENE